VSRHELPGLRVHPLDVGLQLLGLDPPLSPAADLDGRQVTGTDQGIGLGCGDVEHLRNVAELKETRRHGDKSGMSGRAPRLIHRPIRFTWRAAHEAAKMTTVTHPGGSLNSPPRPVATRLQRPSWRDSRLLVGLLLVLAATALGAKAVASADDRVPVFAAATALKPGDRLTSDNLVRIDVQLGDGAAEYLPATGAVPAEHFVLREVRRGELVPVSAVGGRDQVSVQPVTIRVEANSVSSLIAGSVVDVWVSKRDATAGQERYQPAALALHAVSVAWIPSDQGAFGMSASTKAVQVLVGTTDVPVLITATDDQSRITLVPVPGSARAAAS